MPPSDNATLRRGNRSGMRAHSQSAAASMPCTGNKVVLCSSGDSGRRGGAIDPDPVWMQTTVLGLLARAEQRIPVVGVHRRQPEVVHALGERDRLEAALGVAPHVGGRDLGIAQPHELQRDHALRVRAGPHLVVPVVPRAHAREPELGVVAARERDAGEPGDERREAEARPDAGDVHVGDAGVDVPAALAHLVEARRFHRPLVLRTADHRVEPDVREQLVLVGPRLLAVVELDQARRAVDEVRGHAAVEQVGRFDEVVVDRDDREATRGAAPDRAAAALMRVLRTTRPGRAPVSTPSRCTTSPSTIVATKPSVRCSTRLAPAGRSCTTSIGRGAIASGR